MSERKQLVDIQPSEIRTDRPRRKTKKQIYMEAIDIKPMKTTRKGRQKKAAGSIKYREEEPQDLEYIEVVKKPLPRTPVKKIYRESRPLPPTPEESGIDLQYVERPERPRKKKQYIDYKAMEAKRKNVDLVNFYGVPPNKPLPPLPVKEKAYTKTTAGSFKSKTLTSNRNKIRYMFKKIQEAPEDEKNQMLYNYLPKIESIMDDIIELRSLKGSKKSPENQLMAINLQEGKRLNKLIGSYLGGAKRMRDVISITPKLELLIGENLRPL